MNGHLLKPRWPMESFDDHLNNAAAWLQNATGVSNDEAYRLTRVLFIRAEQAALVGFTRSRGLNE